MERLQASTRTASTTGNSTLREPSERTRFFTATAPLQQQIADLNKLVTDQQEKIKNLQEQMQSESATALQQTQTASTAAVQEKAAAHKEGLEYGGGIGAGATLVLVALIFSVRKLTQNFSVSKKPQTRAASA
jgi:hypothetical protein